jgi:hypothetical protein
VRWPRITRNGMSRFRGAKPKKAAFGKPSNEVVTPDPDRQPPVFSFEHMRDGNGYSIECCSDDHRSALASKLFKLTRLTWMEIKNAPRHGLGLETIDRNSIRPSLPAAATADVRIIAIRYNGMHPMVGFRDGRIFHVLFFRPHDGLLSSLSRARDVLTRPSQRPRVR